MMSEVAWDPELPPELIMRGMNSVRTTALTMSAFEMLHGAGSQHLAHEKGREPTAALSYHGEKTDIEISLVRRGHSSELPGVFGGLFDHHVHDVVYGDDSKYLSVLADDRDREQVVLRDVSRCHFPIRHDIDGNRLVGRTSGKYRVLGIPLEQPSQTCRLEQVAGSLIQDEDGVDALPAMICRPNVPKCGSERERLGNRHELGCHQAACRAGRIRKQVP